MIVFRARPEVQDTFRFLGVMVPPTENYYQWAAEAVAICGPFSVQGEYVVTNFSGSGPSPTVGGAYVFASYFLTGEHRNYDRETAVFDQITPHENFLWIDSCDGCCGEGAGAWEVAARWSFLDYDDTGLVAVGGEDGTRGTLSNFTFGINWYWNPQTRLSFNYVHSKLNEAQTGHTARLDAFTSRLQIEF